MLAAISSAAESSKTRKSPSQPQQRLGATWLDEMAEPSAWPEHMIEKGDGP